MLAIEEGNANFVLSGGFLMDVPGRSLVQYFGSQTEIAMPSEIERLGQ
jgi:hypothetical protein